MPSIRHYLTIAVTLASLLVAFTLVDLEAVGRAAARVPFSVLVTVTLALLVGALLACARLLCIAFDLGYRMRSVDAVAALSLGQIGGALFFQLAGQLIARSAVLARSGVPVAGTVLMTGYERLVATAVSLGLAVAGAWFLFGTVSFDLQAGGAAFLKLAAGLVVALAVSGAFVWFRPFHSFARANIGPGAVWRLARSLALSLAIQLCTMAAYVAAVVGLAPGMETLDIVAAAAIVMLAAAVPISLAGWGVRELGAIYALGAIGLDRETALVVAILIGTAALLVVALLATAAALAPRTPRAASPQWTPQMDTPAMLAWAVPVLAAIFVFFQVHVPLTTSRLNVNLADPLAVIGGVLFVLDRIRARQWPAWRLPLFNAHLAAMTCVMVLAFLIGWAEFGLTAWALTNRLVGWFVLLGYVATGALIVSRGGQDGFSVLLRTYAATALAVIAVEMIVFSLIRAGVPLPRAIVAPRLLGFAQNPNAFGLQIMLALAALLVVVRRPRLQTVALGILLTGLWFSGTRAGMIALAIVLVCAFVMGSVHPARLAGAAALTAAAIVVVDWAPEIVMGAAAATRWTIGAAQSAAFAIADLFSSDGTLAQQPWVPGPLMLKPPKYSAAEVVALGYAPSNVQRIASLQGGFELFMEHPIFGAGLGAFIDGYTKAHGVPLVIHSTPVWLLAELGVVGLLAFTAPFIRAMKYETFDPERRDEARVFIILSLLAFGAVSAVHDMMYQRTFWLLIGAALAVPILRADERLSLRSKNVDVPAAADRALPA